MGLFSTSNQDAPSTAPPSAPPRSDRVVRAAAGVTAVVLAAAALKLARPVLVPLVGGVFLAVLARPVQRRVAGAVPRRLRWLGLAAALLVVLAGVGGFGAALAVSGRAVVGALAERRPQLEGAAERARAAAVRAGLPGWALPSLPARGDSAGRQGPESAQRPGQQAGGAGGGAAASAAPRVALGTAEALGALLLALAFCALGLAEADAVRARLARAAPGPGGAALRDALDESARAFRRYAWAKTLTSLLTGAATTGAALALGLPLAWVWGFLAFLLEYVPSVGSALAVVPPTVMALADGGASRGLTAFLVIGALQVVLGNVVDPRIEGRLMAVSPFVVLLSIVVWGWLWGPVGALLAVPMTVALVIACRHVPGLGGVAAVLAGDGAGGRDA